MTKKLMYQKNWEQRSTSFQQQAGFSFLQDTVLINYYYHWLVSKVEWFRPVVQTSVSSLLSGSGSVSLLSFFSVSCWGMYLYLFRLCLFRKMKGKRECEVGGVSVKGGGRMVGWKRGAKDIGWEHCSKVDGNPNRVSCNYCGHHMYGITRLKEHLAHFGTDVVHCLLCPDELKSQMGKVLLQRVVELNEKRRKRGRQEEHDDEEDDAVPVAAVVPEEDDDEKVALDKALQESLKTLEMEKKKAEEEDEELKTALHESARIYQQQQLFNSGEGCSGSDHLEEDIDLNVDVSAADLESV